MKIRVSIIANKGNIGALATLEADVTWLALNAEDINEMQDFKIGNIHQIQIDHDNGTWLWPATFIKP
jgi:hypothetical protein